MYKWNIWVSKNYKSVWILKIEEIIGFFVKKSETDGRCCFLAAFMFQTQYLKILRKPEQNADSCSQVNKAWG